MNLSSWLPFCCCLAAWQPAYHLLTCLSAYLRCPPACLTTCLPDYLPAICLPSACLPAHLLTLPACLPICSPTYLHIIDLPTWAYLGLPVGLSTCLPAYLHTCLLAYLATSVASRVHLEVRSRISGGIVAEKRHTFTGLVSSCQRGLHGGVRTDQQLPFLFCSVCLRVVLNPKGGCSN